MLSLFGQKQLFSANGRPHRQQSAEIESTDYNLTLQSGLMILPYDLTIQQIRPLGKVRPSFVCPAAFETNPDAILGAILGANSPKSNIRTCVLAIPPREISQKFG